MIDHHAPVGLLAELGLLRRLAGRSLDFVWTDGWSATVGAVGLTLVVVPEEVPTPTASHPHADVDRPRVLEERAARTDGGEVIARNCGVVQQVTLLRAQLTFSAVVEGASINILGTTIPPGEDFHVIFLDPEVAPRLRTDAPIVVTDIGIELATNRGRTITFFTRGVGHFVEVAVDAELPRGLLVRRHSLYSDAPA